MSLLKSRLTMTMEELGVLLALEEEPTVAVDEQAVDSDLLDAGP
jgi:hypothetical protein